MNKLSRTIFSFFVLAGVMLLAGAQAFDPFEFLTPVKHYEMHAGIVYGDQLLSQQSESSGPLQLMPGSSGTISVQTWHGHCANIDLAEPIGFQVAIRDAETNTMWMYSQDILQEVDVSDLLSHCKLGDVLVFMTVDRQYKMGRHEVKVMDGC